MPGEWHPDVLGGLALLAAAHVLATRRAREPLLSSRTAAMAAAVAVLAAALNGPLHDLSDRYLFSAHMIQHLILTLVFPPLFLLSLTPGRLAPAMAIPWVAAVLRRLTRPPLALALYSAAMVVWHLPGPYDAALEWHPLHIVQHLTFLTTAVLAWWPVLSPSPAAPPVAFPAQLLYLFLLGLPMMAIAALVTMADTPLYRFYAAAPRVWALSPLDDQRLGGLIMWIPGSVVPLIAATAVFFRWAAAEREE